MQLSAAERAVVRAALERGYLTRAQVDEALALEHPPGALAKLAERLTVVQVNALRAVYEAAQAPGGGAAQTLAPSAGAPLPPSRQAVEPAAPARDESPPEQREQHTLRPESASEADSPVSALPSKTQPLQPGNVLGNYRIVSELARGGMGIVYVAQHVELGRRVALKLLMSPGGATRKQIERFLTEARAAARLRHPNVVAVHEVGSLGGHQFMVMDLVEGEGLDARIARAGPFAPAEAARITAEVARALHHGHEVGVLHRDVKPSNVLLTSSGVPLLTDFGLARMSDQSRESLTKTGEVMGTPAFMPPEQAVGDAKRADRRADVYSLGATLYCLLTGNPPFQAESLVLLLARIHRAEVEPPSRAQRAVPRALDAIVLKALEKDPDDRYATAEEFAADLDRFLAGDGVEARLPRGGLGVVAVALGFVAILTGGLALTRGNPSDPPDDVAAQTSEQSESKPEIPAEPTPEPVDPRGPAPSNALPQLKSRETVDVRGSDWRFALGFDKPRLVRALEQEHEQALLWSVSVNPDATGPRFAAVWRSDPRERPRPRFFDDPRQAYVFANGIFGRNRQVHRRRPFRACTYEEGGQTRSVVSFVKDGLKGAANYTLNPATVEGDRVKRFRSGLSPRWITGNGEASSPLCLLYTNTQEAGLYRWPLTGRELLDEVRDQARRGYTLMSLAPVGPLSHEKRTYAAIWKQTPLDTQPFALYVPRDPQVLAENLRDDGFEPLFVVETGLPERRELTMTWLRDPSTYVWTAQGEGEELGLDGPAQGFMRKHRVTRASLALTRRGRLIALRALTLSTPRAKPTRPESRFRIGKLSMVLTAATALELVEAGQLDLDQPLSELLPEFVATAGRVEPRVAELRLRHLLQHRPGWQIDATDLYPKRTELELVMRTVGERDHVPRTPSFLLDQLAHERMDRAPGTPHEFHSEVGAMLLGEVIARVSGTTYERAVRDRVLGPLRARTFGLGYRSLEERLPDEVGYDGPTVSTDQVSVHGGKVPRQYGACSMRAQRASRGWIASAADVARLLVELTRTDGGAVFEASTKATLLRERMVLQVDGDPSDPRLWWADRGSGTTVHVERLPNDVCLVILLNRRASPSQWLVDTIGKQLAERTEWPEEDLFERY